MRRKVMAGNWKMYKTVADTGAYFEKFRPLVAETRDREIVLCPAFVSLMAAVESARGTNIGIGGQNLFWLKEGAFTGEISADMLAGVGCRWVLVAHSERRQYFGETDETAFKKVEAALAAGLTPVICIGETLTEREAGRTFSVLETQFRAGVARLSAERFAKVTVAYEPVWAIGTGKTATPELAAEAHAFIRGQAAACYGAEQAAALRILYGGSVKPDNVRALMAQPDLDGALVGGASLSPEGFAAIVNY